MSESLNSFLGKKDTGSSPTRGLSLNDFLQGTLPKAPTPEPAAPISVEPESGSNDALEAELVFVNQEIVIPLIDDPFDEQPGPVEIIVPTDRSNTFAGGEYSRGPSQKQIILTHDPARMAGAVTYFEVRTEFDVLQKTTIPQFSALLRLHQLGEFLSVFGGETGIMRTYLQAVSALDPDQTYDIADQVDEFLSRKFDIDEFHPSFRRDLPVPDFTLQVDPRDVWISVSISGKAIDADWIGIIGNVPQRIEVDGGGSFAGTLVHQGNSSTGMMIYSLNTRTHEKSPLSKIIFTPPPIPEILAQHFELAGLLDQVRPEWAGDTDRYVRGAKQIIFQAAVRELGSAQRSGTLQEILMPLQAPRLLTVTQREIVRLAGID